VLFAHLAQALDHLVHRYARQRQRVGGQHHARLQRFRHHLGGAGGVELFDVVLLPRPRDDGDIGAQFAHAMDHAQRGVDVGEGDDHHAGARQAGRQQGFLFR
jgi:hypothetical protein